MRKYQTLIFDLDDTLIDNHQSVRYAFLKTLEYLNLPYNEEYFEKWKAFDKAYWHMRESGKMVIPENIVLLKDKITYVRTNRFIKFFKDLNLSFDEVVKINDIYCKSLGENIVEVDGASKVLNKLKEDYEIIIATNGPRFAALDKIKKIKVANCVSTIVSAEDIGFSKPMPEFFDYMVKKSKSNDKRKMLLIGDGLTTDVLGGIKNDIDTCWFNPQMINGPADYSPTMMITNLSQLEDILLNDKMLG